MTAITATTARTTASARRTPLIGAVVAGPLWVTVSVAQAATRDGFDITRHPLSLLSTGPATVAAGSGVGSVAGLETAGVVSLVVSRVSRFSA